MAKDAVWEFDLLPCPVLVTDYKGLVLAANTSLFHMLGDDEEVWVSKPMDAMFSKGSQIFLQTHVWPILLRDAHINEIYLQLLDETRQRIPVLLNCKKAVRDGFECFFWVFFITRERSRYEQALLEARQIADAATTRFAQSERFVRTVTDSLPCMIAYWDQQLQCQFANQPYVEWFGRTPSAMLGMSMSELLGEHLFTLNSPYIEGALAGKFQEFEREIPRPCGGVGHVLANYVPDIDAGGSVKGFYALVSNITRLRGADTAIRLTASVFDATTEGIMVTDASSVILSVNPAFTLLTGYAAEEVVGKNARLLKSGRHDAAFFGEMYEALRADKLWKGEIWSQRKDGSHFLERLSIATTLNDAGEVIRYVGVFDDVTEQWGKDQLVRHMALHDQLTGLPNRFLLMERLGQLIGISNREPRRIALMYMDLDGFKLVNDTYGHGVGDKVLQAISSRLKDLLRVTDSVARIGGDEFVLLLDNPENRESVAAVAARIIKTVNIPMCFDDMAVHVGASIGIAFFQNDGKLPEGLIKEADAAMYAAKTAGKNVFRFSD
ncbi:diguanylate cyclase (GGDEF)-like protein/PAS domain S-box-containing protein [Actimicrobium sp. GrIS 1.19]|uniref:sensor domain-containing protein n=1 Tax=Actimicrobium sp. GrIS 1.19 TaxID=3071708 RepID=UPI002E0B9522|nr:diguanylate cyclase (GGDEF)-like protein/PAS domain S-box-containing protein [Actimicrobium sp. GrIS 1.19]